MDAQVQIPEMGHATQVKSVQVREERVRDLVLTVSGFVVHFESIHVENHQVKI
jgi:hypothetical protein